MLVNQITTEVATGPTPAPSPFSSLRLTQNFGETLGVKKVLTTVPVGRPSKDLFDDNYRGRLTTTMLAGRIFPRPWKFWAVSPALKTGTPFSRPDGSSLNFCERLSVGYRPVLQVSSTERLVQ
jgi:hypothetical protein